MGLSGEWPWQESDARDWRGLSADLLDLVDRMEQEATAGSSVATTHICITIEPDHTCLALSWCDASGCPAIGAGPPISLRFARLEEPEAGWPGTDCRRHPTQQALDHAICELGQDLICWSRNPETFEAVECPRFSLFVAWPGKRAVAVELWRYGIDGLI